MKILAAVLTGVLTAFAFVGKGFSAANRKLDRFRRNEVSAILVNSAIWMIVICIALCIFMACKPGMDASRACTLARKGNAEGAVRLVNALERGGYDEAKLLATREEVAAGLIESGKYAEGASVLADVPAGGNRDALEKRSTYLQACDRFEEGRYSEAAQTFYQMTDYADSAAYYADCRCALAIEAYLSGNESSARSLLLDVPDVVARVKAAAIRITGGEAEAQTILSAELFREDALNRMEETMAELSAARSDMPNGRIAAGQKHTVGLTSSGTVLATGDNAYGQCDVSSWNSVTQVAAGAYHTVALRSDGTVVAVGDNSQQQCDVSGWSGITAIAAGAYDTIGLCADGTVVAAGMHADLVSGWHGVTFVDGGSYALGCLYDKGAMMSSHKGAQMEMGTVLYDLSVCGQTSVGVLYDGTLVSSSEMAPQWTEIVTATAFEGGVLGIDVNGQVRAHFYRSGEQMDITVPGQAIEVESSGSHHVVLTSDGKVHAFGDNGSGQCGVADWQL